MAGLLLGRLGLGGLGLVRPVTGPAVVLPLPITPRPPGSARTADNLEFLRGLTCPAILSLGHGRAAFFAREFAGRRGRLRVATLGQLRPRRLRKIIKTRGHYPSDDAATNLIAQHHC